MIDARRLPLLPGPSGTPPICPPPNPPIRRERARHPFAGVLIDMPRGSGFVSRSHSRMPRPRELPTRSAPGSYWVALLV